MPIQIADVIGDRYEILSCLGQGGMSAVYEAFDRQLKRHVAAKFLVANKPTANLRFQREARVTANLDHPCIAQVFDFGFTKSDQPFLIMELVQGRTLAARIAIEGQLPVMETVRIFALICDGLVCAHEKKVLHRDIKPSNIMLTGGDGEASEVKILDFGIAKFLESPGKNLSLTQSRELLGSPFYMSPEQAKGLPIDGRSDLYSLGCTLYECLTGGPPHIGESPMSTIMKREVDKPLRLSEASMGKNFPEALENIVARLLERNPDDRYQTALELQEELLNFLHEDTHTQSNSVAPAVAQQISTSSKSTSFEMTAYALILIGILAPVIVWTFTRMPGAKAPVVVTTSPREPTNGPTVLEEQPIRAALRTARADALRSQKRYDEAAEAYKQAFYEYQHAPSEHNLEAASTLYDLGTSYFFAQHYKQAAEVLEQSREIYRKTAGASDREILKTLDRLAQCYRKDGKNAKATEVEDEIFRIEMSFAPDQTHSSKNASMAGKLAASYRSNKNYSKAISYDNVALDLSCKTSDIPLEIQSLMSLGIDYKELSQYRNKSMLALAESNYLKALALIKKNPDVDKKWLGNVSRRLADIYHIFAHLENGARKLQYASQAEKYYQSAVDVYKAYGTKVSNEAALAYRSYAEMESFLGRFALAEQNYSKALVCYKHVPGGCIKDRAYVTYELAETCREHGLLDESEKYYRQALPLYRIHFGAHSVQTADLLAGLGETLRRHNQLKEARQFLLESLAIRQKTPGESGPAADWTKRTLASIDSALAADHTLTGEQR